MCRCWHSLRRPPPGCSGMLCSSWPCSTASCSAPASTAATSGAQVHRAMHKVCSGMLAPGQFRVSPGEEERRESRYLHACIYAWFLHIAKVWLLLRGHLPCTGTRWSKRRPNLTTPSAKWLTASGATSATTGACSAASCTACPGTTAKRSLLSCRSVPICLSSCHLVCEQMPHGCMK